MISSESVPRLAPKARLRFDRKSERTMLLFPERGLELSATAAEIIKLCTGEHSVAAIVDKLAERFSSPDRETVEREVIAFLERMVDQCLVRLDR